MQIWIQTHIKHKITCRCCLQEVSVLWVFFLKLFIFQISTSPCIHTFNGCLSLPINQTGFPHSQVTHHDDLRDFKSAEEKEKKKHQQVDKKKSASVFWFLCSPHGARALLLTGSPHFVVEIVFSVQSGLFPEILQNKETLTDCTLFYVDECDVTLWLHLRELSDDTVLSYRRKNTHGCNSDRHEASTWMFSRKIINNLISEQLKPVSSSFIDCSEWFEA